MTRHTAAIGLILAGAFLAASVLINDFPYANLRAVGITILFLTLAYSAYRRHNR